MSIHRRWIPLLAFVCSACLIPMQGSVKELLPANGPEGDSVTVSLRGTSEVYVGELLAVDSARLAFLQDPNIREVRWADVKQVMLQSYKRTVFIAGVPPDTAEMTLLRAMSRFPQGMDSTLAARVRAARREALRLP